MKNIKKRIECLNAVMHNTIEAARIAIYDILKENDGFIFVDDGGDAIYGYALDEDEILQEYYVRGLRINKNDDVEVYLAPILHNCKVTYTAEDLKNYGDEEDWYSISGADGSLYPWETIISILQSINQYSK